MTARQKTGTDVSCPSSRCCARTAKGAQWKSEYVFWSGEGEEESITKSWAKLYLAPLFKAAKLSSNGYMKSHRLRDTFAVDLLEKGVPLEEVSKLLGHEKHQDHRKALFEMDERPARPARLSCVGSWTVSEPRLMAKKTPQYIRQRRNQAQPKKAHPSSASENWGWKSWLAFAMTTLGVILAVPTIKATPSVLTETPLDPSNVMSTPFVIENDTYFDFVGLHVAAISKDINTTFAHAGTIASGWNPLPIPPELNAGEREQSRTLSGMYALEGLSCPAILAWSFHIGYGGYPFGKGAEDSYSASAYKQTATADSNNNRVSR